MSNFQYFGHTFENFWKKILNNFWDHSMSNFQHFGNIFEDLLKWLNEQFLTISNFFIKNCQHIRKIFGQKRMRRVKLSLFSIVLSTTIQQNLPERQWLSRRLFSLIGQINEMREFNVSSFRRAWILDVNKLA